MTKVPAFNTVDLTDMIGKIGDKLAHPIDYVASIIGESYMPGAQVNITVRPEQITVKSSGTIEEGRLVAAGKNNPLELFRLTPTTPEFQKVALSSGTKSLQIRMDAEDGKGMAVEETEGIEGTLLEILTGTDFTSQTKRLAELYKGSDLQITVNEIMLSKGAAGFGFNAEGLRGSIEYDPKETGGLNFFDKGRYIQTLPGIPGIRISLYEHGLPTTITKSRVIINGTAEKARLKAICQQELPRALANMLTSKYAEELRQTSERSFMTLARSAYNAFPNSPEISEIYRQFTTRPHAQSTGPMQNLPYAGEAPLTKTGPHDGQMPKQKKPGILRRTGMAAAIAGLLFIAQGDLTAKIPNGNLMPAQNAQQYSTQEKSFRNSDIRDIADYMTNQALAQGLMQPRNVSAGKGYARIATKNTLYLGNNGFEWENASQSGTLTSHATIKIPEELKGLENASNEEKIQATMNYIKNFEYGTIEPDKSLEYENFADAMESEQVAFCTTANSLGAAILAQLGVANIRYAEGFHDGIGHAWDEINVGGKWQVLDFTPANATFTLESALVSFETGNENSQAETYQTKGLTYQKNTAIYHTAGVSNPQQAEITSTAGGRHKITLWDVVNEIGAVTALAAGGFAVGGLGITIMRGWEAMVKRRSVANVHLYRPGDFEKKFGMRAVDNSQILHTLEVKGEFVAVGTSREELLGKAYEMMPRLGITPEEEAVVYTEIAKS